jgi:pilus assembly protein CpaB
MNVKKWAPLALALLLGLIAAKLALNFISHRSNTPVAAADTHLEQVVVAKREIGPAQSLTPDDLTLESISRDGAAPDTFSAPTDLLDRVTAAPLIQGQVITASLLIPKGESPGLAAIVPQGMRAITVAISEITGVGGYIQPGCHVDIIESVMQANSGGDRTKLVCLPIVQNIKVTAVGHRLNPNPPEGEGPATPVSHVTLLVTPEQAERIQLAVATGQPAMVLRGDGDETPMPSAGVTVAQLTGDDTAAPTTAPAAPQVAATDKPAPVTTRTVYMIRGGEVSAMVVKLPAPTTQPDSSTAFGGE